MSAIPAAIGWVVIVLAALAGILQVAGLALTWYARTTGTLALRFVYAYRRAKREGGDNLRVWVGPAEDPTDSAVSTEDDTA